jgi:hypothetical protein
MYKWVVNIEHMRVAYKIWRVVYRVWEEIYRIWWDKIHN